MLLTQIIRQLFHFIDSNLYNFIPVMYDLIISISRTSVLSQAQIKEFADRIQVILGAFMLFKVSISLILYIVNPDDFSDKSKGFGKLWLNIIISLLLLVGTPYIFSLAYQFQTKVLEDDSLAELIMGESDENVSYIYTAGDKIAFRVMLPFFTPNSSIPSLESCANLINANGQLTDECYQDMLNLKTGKDTAVSSTIVGNYKWGVDYGSLGLTFRLDTAKQIVKGSDGNEYFLIDYKAGISTVAAVIVLLVLTTFCMDIALRSIKLAFLQLIAPIPIISYIDPKSGKDGMFKKWYEMAFKTYLSLFIRLIALYFGIYIISKTTGMYDSVTGASVNNFTIQLFIIIGVLMFVKQLPKILEGIGIKLDGDGKFNLNPFKKFEDEALGGKQILSTARGIGATALAAGAAGGTNALNTINKIRDARAKGESVARAVGSGVLSTLAGTISGANRGLVGTIQGKKFGEVYSKSYSGAMQARQRREDRRADGVAWYEPIGASIQKTLGMHTRADVVKKVEENLKTYQSTYDNIKNVVSSSDATGKELSKRIESMKKQSIDPGAFNLADPAQLAAYNNQVKAHNAAIKAVEDELEKRIDDIAHGFASVTDSSGNVMSAAQAAIDESTQLMNKLRTSINNTAPTIDKDFEIIPEYTYDPADPDHTIGYTKQFKASKGSQSQFTAAHESTKAKDIDTHSRGIGPIAQNNKK